MISAPKRRAGSVKVMSSWWALNSSRKESSSMGSPRGVRSAISWPLRKTPSVFVSGLVQSRCVIRLPSGRNHHASGNPLSPAVPVRIVRSASGSTVAVKRSQP
jgi:hypothetical protein